MHVHDVIDAVLLAAGWLAPCLVATFNVATGDYVTVGEIAAMAVKVAGLDPGGTVFEFSGTDRGWKGDVPVVRLDTSRIRRLGWSNLMSSASRLLRSSLESMVEDARSGRLS